MTIFLFFLTASFFWGFFLWDRKPSWHGYFLTGFIVLLCVAYLFFNKL